MRRTSVNRQSPLLQLEPRPGLAVVLLALAAGLMWFVLRPAYTHLHDPPRRIPWALPDATQAVTAHEVLPDGRIHLTIEHRPLPGGTPEMLAWWYRVLPLSQVEFDGAVRPMYHLSHPTEHGRIWIEEPAADGQPGAGAGAVVARLEWFGPFDSDGAARVIELSPRRFLTHPKIAS